MWASRQLSSVLAALIVVISLSSVHAEALGKECWSNSDCGEGASCVAGDSEKAVQRCVAGQACGGPFAGGCPGDEVSGQLACIWRPVNTDVCVSTPAGCKKVNGQFGIYKCISIDRCDQYFGNEQCSSGCNVHGKQCNGRGVCQLKETKDDSIEFQCSCESGWNGTRCDYVVNDSCIADVGQCGDHGICVDNACKCLDDYTGIQCEIKPASSKSGSNSSENNSSSGSGHNIVKPTSKPDGKTKENNKAASDAADTSSVIKEPKSSGVSATVIIFSVLAAVIVVAALIFIVIARKKRQEQEAAAEADSANFNRASSVDGALAAGAPTTPKQKIVIM